MEENGKFVKRNGSKNNFKRNKKWYYKNKKKKPKYEKASVEDLQRLKEHFEGLG
jgi:hypothetical protein